MIDPPFFAWFGVAFFVGSWVLGAIALYKIGKLWDDREDAIGEESA